MRVSVGSANYQNTPLAGASKGRSLHHNIYECGRLGNFGIRIYSGIYMNAVVSQTNVPQIIEIAVSRIISLHPLHFSIFPDTYTVLDFIGHLDT